MEEKPKFEICQSAGGRLFVTVRSLRDMLSEAVTDNDQEHDYRIWLAVRSSLAKLDHELSIAVLEFCQDEEDTHMQAYKEMKETDGQEQT